MFCVFSSTDATKNVSRYKEIEEEQTKEINIVIFYWG